MEDISELLTAARRAATEDESSSYRPSFLAMLRRDTASANISDEQRGEAKSLADQLEVMIDA